MNKYAITRSEYEALCSFRQDTPGVDVVLDLVVANPECVNNGALRDEMSEIGCAWNALRAERKYTVMGGSDELMKRRKEQVDEIYEVAK